MVVEDRIEKEKARRKQEQEAIELKASIRVGLSFLQFTSIQIEVRRFHDTQKTLKSIVLYYPHLSLKMYNGHLKACVLCQTNAVGIHGKSSITVWIYIIWHL